MIWLHLGMSEKSMGITKRKNEWEPSIFFLKKKKQEKKDRKGSQQKLMGFL